jgi:uncharacterized protein
MRARRGLLAAVLLLAPALCAAAIVFPPLTGRVVDSAGMLSAGTQQALTELLAAHEQASSDQIVVVTLPDLQGYTIEEYGYQLGRHWGIGQKGKNNGVLLLVAPNERALRIEVGYGLEGTLTDALSSNIINGVILPRFKRGDFEGGITQGVAAIIQALGGEYELKQIPRNQGAPGRGHASPLGVLFWIIFILIFSRGWWGWGLFGRGYGGWGGGGGGGGGFHGGGGSFGGGGASGRW